MCGICGIINFDGSPVDPAILEGMRDMLAHRGPDDRGAVLVARDSSKGNTEYLRFQE